MNNLRKLKIAEFKAKNNYKIPGITCCYNCKFSSKDSDGGYSCYKLEELGLKWWDAKVMAMAVCKLHEGIKF